MQAIREIDGEQALEEAFQSEIAIFFKHSTICGISAAAFREIERFAEDHFDVPIFLIDVRAQRGLSRRTAEHFNIRHESPQVIVIKNGRPTWNNSHWAITADKIAKAIVGD
jgi:bacillithiol system protein YtxJ